MLKVMIRVFHRPIFLEKKIRGTRQTVNYLYTFHSNPKHLPKVKSRGGWTTQTNVFSCDFSCGFAKKNVEKIFMFEFTGCFY